MSTRLPKGKGARTKTARLLTAIAKDLRQATEGFESAVGIYKNGDIDVALAARIADIAFDLAHNHALRSYYDHFKPWAGNKENES